MWRVFFPDKIISKDDILSTPWTRSSLESSCQVSIKKPQLQSAFSIFQFYVAFEASEMKPRVASHDIMQISGVKPFCGIPRHYKGKENMAWGNLSHVCPLTLPNPLRSLKACHSPRSLFVFLSDTILEEAKAWLFCTHQSVESASPLRELLEEESL